MTEFAQLPAALSHEELQRIRESGPDAAKESAMHLLRGYEALLSRLRLAELALYRAKALAEDMDAITKSEAKKGRKQSPEGLVGMARSFEKTYIDVILPPVREALGFEEGDEAQGWYLPAEEVRAKLLGNVRAKERLAREGHRFP